MQESIIYGLECPISVLSENIEGSYLNRALEILEYAKICRIGENNKTVTFIHRRFQEYFLVKNILEQGKTIKADKYKDIVNNIGMRDALVLYCEVVEENEAKKIAEYCWEIIKRNIVYANNIWETGCCELVNTLYFISEAFRNRKSAIIGFKKDLEQLINNNISKDTDFIVLRTLTKSMVLCDQNYLQSIVLKVFELKSRWLNDIVMENSRAIKKLDTEIEIQFITYFLGQIYILYMKLEYIHGFSHGQQTDIGKEDVAIFDQVLRTVLCDIHMVAVFYKIVFSE